VTVTRRSVYTQICSSLLHIPCHDAGLEALLWGRFCYHGDDTEQKESSLGTTRAMCMCVRTVTGIYRAGTFISPSVSECQVKRSLVMLKDSHGICVFGTLRHRLTECDNIATVVENGVFYSTQELATIRRKTLCRPWRPLSHNLDFILQTSLYIC